jgi:hypothetical protein
MSYMMPSSWITDRKRSRPRIELEAFCSEILERGQRHAIAVDLCEDGLRIQRPPGLAPEPLVQLEVELPGIDEVVWLCGAVRFDRVHHQGHTGHGLSGVIRTTGIQLVAAAARHRRLLREYVMDSWLETAPAF